MNIPFEETGSLTPYIYDTLTVTQQAVLAHYYECKSMAVGYGIIGIVFVILTIVFGLSYIYSSKKTNTEHRSVTNGLKMMGMICSFILSTALFITSVYYAAKLYVADKTPIGSYQLKYGNNSQFNGNKIVIDINEVDSIK